MNPWHPVTEGEDTLAIRHGDGKHGPASLKRPNYNRGFPMINGLAHRDREKAATPPVGHVI